MGCFGSTFPTYDAGLFFVNVAFENDSDVVPWGAGSRG